MKYQIALVVPGAPFEGDSLEKHSLGGSETAGLYMARELARLGHKVTVFSTTEKPGVYGGVSYLPFDFHFDWTRTIPHDIAIFQRMMNGFSDRTAAKLNILWCHDLIEPDQVEMLEVAKWNIDAIFVLSKFMAKQYEEAAGLSRDTLWVTSNGLDGDFIREIAPAGERDPFHLFYSARPERGLDVLLRDIMPRVLNKEPRARLSVTTYHNPAQNSAVLEFRACYEECDRLIAGLGDRVTKLGNLNKRQLYAAMKTAAIYAYPTPSPVKPDFAEISCISVMEARACGMHVIATPTGALPESAPDGTFVAGKPGTPQFADAFSEAILGNFKRLSQDARILFDWRNVAHTWSEKFDAMFAERNDDKRRLAYHFYKRSDVEAVKRLVLECDDEFLRNEIRKSQDLRESMGLKEIAPPAKSDTDRRSIWIEGVLENEANRLKRRLKICDYAALVDMNEAVAMDAVILTEILAQDYNPSETLLTFEQRNPGALVIVSAPMGPHEYLTSDWQTRRRQLRAFELWDLLEIFRGKQVLGFEPIPTHFHPILGEDVGHFLLAYRADGFATKPIDWERKLKLQRPAQTLSLRITADSSANTAIRDALAGAQLIADEIAVAGKDPCTMDWILSLEAGERLVNPEALLKYLRQNCFDAYLIKQADGLPEARLIRNDKNAAQRNRLWMLPDVHIVMAT